MSALDASSWAAAGRSLRARSRCFRTIPDRPEPQALRVERPSVPVRLGRGPAVPVSTAAVRREPAGRWASEVPEQGAGSGELGAGQLGAGRPFASAYPAGVTAVSTIRRMTGFSRLLHAGRDASLCSLLPAPRSLLPAPCSPAVDCVQPTAARPRPRRPGGPERQP